MTEPSAPTPDPPPPDVLLADLRSAIRTGDRPAMEKAIAAVGLSLADPDRSLDTADLQPLTPERRQLLQRYHQLLVALGDQLASGDGRFDPESVINRVDDLFGARPLHIDKVELCQRVRGYGVYEPFDSRVFLAGREQPMIIYTELKNFRSEPTADGHHAVKLTQEVVLYNESDGLAVWRQPSVEITDESRNRRRDFFVVQMVRLPARLSVGKYLLKVRITDLASDTLDESTIPIQFVADHALVAHGAGQK